MEEMYNQSQPEEAQGSVDEEEAEAMETSAMVPLKMVTPHDGKGVKVGDEIMVRVKAIHGDQAEIVYATDKHEEGEEGEHGMGMHEDMDLEKMNEGGGY